MPLAQSPAEAAVISAGREHVLPSSLRWSQCPVSSPKGMSALPTWLPVTQSARDHPDGSQFFWKLSLEVASHHFGHIPFISVSH